MPEVFWSFDPTDLLSSPPLNEVLCRINTPKIRLQGGGMDVACPYTHFWFNNMCVENSVKAWQFILNMIQHLISIFINLTPANLHLTMVRCY